MTIRWRRHGAHLAGFVAGAAAVIRVRRLFAEVDASRAELERREHYYRSLVERVSDHLVVLGPDLIPRYASPALLELTGLRFDQLVDEHVLPRFVAPDDLGRVKASLERAAAEPGVPFQAEVRVRGADGETRTCIGVTTNLVDDPAVAGFVVVLHDISERKALEEELRVRALHDDLTGLPNRALIDDRLAQMCARARRRASSVAVLFVDLDNFKNINDTLGHAVGDGVLRAVARRLELALRRGDTVGRFGGDEFIVLSEDGSLPVEPELLAERIQAVLAEPFELTGGRGTVAVSASIGIAQGDGPPERLMSNADVALYRAKAGGRHCHVVFKPEMYQAMEDRLALELDLQEALGREEFFLVFQPVVDLGTLEMVGVEALLRWRHPARGVLAPDQFVPLLEGSGLIVDVGRWVLRTACRQAARWREDGLRIWTSVNVSALQITPGFAGVVEAAILESGLDPAALVLELTESMLARDGPETRACLERFRELGVRTAIDDFGTGYSSMSYLRHFPIDVIKIDRSFVAGLGDPQAATLIRTLVGLGRDLGLETIAEGIEEEAQLRELRADLCESGQGHLFARPLPAAEVETFARAAPAQRRALAGQSGATSR